MEATERKGDVKPLEPPDSLYLQAAQGYRAAKRLSKAATKQRIKAR